MAFLKAWRGELTNLGNAQSKSFAVWLGLLGAGTGLLVGLYEAALLCSRPRIPSLLKPDVGNFVWFLVPLVDELAFGLLGVALGIAAQIWRPSTPQRLAAFAGGGLGAAAAFMVYDTFWICLWTGRHSSRTQTFIVLTGVFAAVLGFTHFGSRLWASRLCRFLERNIAALSRSLAKTVAAATGILIAGLAFHFIELPHSSPSAQAISFPRAHRPNIVLISLDTVRADHLHCYGYARPTTPNLDRLAAQGVLFENAIAPSSWTLASHASIFTGLLPHQHGANFGVPLASGLLTLAQVLKSRGYERAGFTANYDYGFAGWGIGQGFESYVDDSSWLPHSFWMTVVGRVFRKFFYTPVISYDRFGRRDGHDLNHAVFRWLRHRSERPFFLFINYFDAHDPYVAPFPYNKHFGSVSNALVRRLSPFIHQKPLPQRLSEEEQASLVAGYDNCLAFLDEQVGELLRFLAGSAERSNTIIIVTADHGEGFGEHGGYYGHGWSLYWEVLHVPLIIAGPGFPAGLRISQIASNRDIFPLVLTLAGGEGTLGERCSLCRFLLPRLRARDSDEAIVSELAPVPGVTNLHPASISLVTPQWHYIRDADGRSQVYYWPTDPLEKTNLFGSLEHAGIVQPLQQQLWNLVQVSKRPWLGVDYLPALGQLGSPFFDRAGLPRDRRSILPRSKEKEEEELLESLPYR